MSKILISIIVLLFTFAFSGVSHAGQCNITATPLSFGVYDIFNPTPITSTATLSINCKNPPKIATTVTVQLSTGNSGNFSQRNMVSATGAQLLYNIYTDATAANVFGDGNGNSGSPSRIVDKFNPWEINLYGQILPLQNVPVGVYSDTLTATILW